MVCIPMMMRGRIVTSLLALQLRLLFHSADVSNFGMDEELITHGSNDGFYDPRIDASALGCGSIVGTAAGTVFSNECICLSWLQLSKIFMMMYAVFS